MAGADGGDAGIARGGMELGECRASSEPPGERVLAGARADDQDSHAPSLVSPPDRLGSGGLRLGRTRHDNGVQEPGLDKHAWETEWEDLEPLVADSPAEALPELDRLVAQMMDARGFPLTDNEAEDTAEPDTVREFVEARRVTRLLDSGEAVDPGDVALAVNAYRNLYHYLLELGPA
jgi:hypothetical protein